MATKRKRPGQVAKILAAEKSTRGFSTYAQWADFLRVPVSVAHDWTTGKYEPTLASLRKLARRLERQVADFVEAA